MSKLDPTPIKVRGGWDFVSLLAEGQQIDKENNMPDLYKQYQAEHYQEVYDELLSMQESIYNADLYEESLLVMRSIMKRVRHNIEQIVPRLHQMGYLFYKAGFWEHFRPEKKMNLEQEYPIFQ